MYSDDDDDHATHCITICYCPSREWLPSMVHTEHSERFFSAYIYFVTDFNISSGCYLLEWSGVKWNIAVFWWTGKKRTINLFRFTALGLRVPTTKWMWDEMVFLLSRNTQRFDMVRSCINCILTSIFFSFVFPAHFFFSRTINECGRVVSSKQFNAKGRSND